MTSKDVVFVWSSEHLRTTTLAPRDSDSRGFYSFFTKRKACLKDTEPLGTYLSTYAIVALLVVGIVYRALPDSEHAKTAAKLLRPLSEVVLIWGVSETMAFFPYLVDSPIRRTVFSVFTHALQFGFFWGVVAYPAGYALALGIGVAYLLALWQAWGECPYPSSAIAIFSGALAYATVRLDTELF